MGGYLFYLCRVMAWPSCTRFRWQSLAQRAVYAVCWVHCSGGTALIPAACFKDIAKRRQLCVAFTVHKELEPPRTVCGAAMQLYFMRAMLPECYGPRCPGT